MRYSKENFSVKEYPPELLQSYILTFFNRQDTYALQQEDRRYYRVQKPLTTHLVNAHLKGLLTIGTYALDKQSQARWLCLDADEPEPWEALKELARKLEIEGVIPYLESSRRGGHCWLFTAPLSGQQMRQFGKGLCQKYGLPPMELYPKQDKIEGGTGSLVRLPLGIHRQTGKRYPFITPEGQLLAPTLQQQLELLAPPLLVPEEFISKISAEVSTSATLVNHPHELSKVKPVPGEYLSQRIKGAISVYDFVSHYVELDQHGKGLCPFHEDRVKSFQVNIRENYWHCYAGCGGGSVIDFRMKWRQFHGQDGSFTATIKELGAMLL